MSSTRAHVCVMHSLYIQWEIQAVMNVRIGRMSFLYQLLLNTLDWIPGFKMNLILILILIPIKQCQERDHQCQQALKLVLTLIILSLKWFLHVANHTPIDNSLETADNKDCFEKKYANVNFAHLFLMLEGKTVP